MNTVRLTHNLFIWSDPAIQKQFQRLQTCKNDRIRKLRYKLLTKLLINEAK